MFGFAHTTSLRGASLATLGLACGFVLWSMSAFSCSPNSFVDAVHDTEINYENSVSFDGGGERGESRDSSFSEPPVVDRALPQPDDPSLKDGSAHEPMTDEVGEHRSDFNHDVHVDMSTDGPANADVSGPETSSEGSPDMSTSDAGKGEFHQEANGDGPPDRLLVPEPGHESTLPEQSSPATGFPTTAATWSVPPSGTSRGFFSVAAASGGEYWALVDLDGDKKPDLVQTADPSSQKIWGGSRGYWQFYRNTGSGFASTATRWTVPLSGTSKGFYLTASASSGGYWTLVDLNGDAKPDLVQTADPSTQKIWGGSQGYWKVFLNNGSGFSGTATPWTVPNSGTSKGFYTAAAASSGQYWVLVDLDGDKKPDLVQTADPSSQKIWGGSRGYWKCYANTGAGFRITASAWSVPSSQTSKGFYLTASASATEVWSLVDLDGDGKPELVQTADPRTQKVWGGSSGYWLRFANTGSGFAALGTRWLVPNSGTNKGFYTIAAASSGQYWALVDLDGDKKPDLVQTADPSNQKIWGGSRGYWKRYANTGSRFATSASNWSVPVSGTSKGFFIPGSASGSEVWSLVDMNGDQKPDLVQSADPITRKVWGGSRGHWRVFSP